MSYDYAKCERSLECLFGFVTLGKIKFLVRFRILRAQGPASEDETGHQNYLCAIDISLRWCRTKKKRYQLPENVPATRGLLATDHVILNRGQVTWTTPELAPPSPNYHTTPMGGRFSSRRFNMHRCPTRRVFSGTGLELMTGQTPVRYLYHSATAATTDSPQSYSKF
ncbi:uncharacterized protein TNCV_2978171 [Trichonephila clavipes]|nr:uncharacterized protein TNCV_2978171 [Trichonephila clavipes]